MSSEHKLGTGANCFGTGVIYTARSNRWIHVQGDYEFDLRANTFPKESRAYRKAAKFWGRKRSLRDEALKNETVVVFGPDVTAVQAIALLRKLADEINKQGLFAGLDHLDRRVFEKKIIQI
jgi:hypothetical protein